MPCPWCDDTGWKPIDVDGVRRVVRCDCWRDRSVRQRLTDANIPKRYQHCTFENFVAYNDSLKRAVEDARAVVERFLHAMNVEQRGRGLLLEGPPGVGKTHLAVAVLKDVVSTFGANGLFYDTRELLKLIR